MNEDKEVAVRIHVGGLPKGVNSNDLASLFARALPAGSAFPSAEVIKDLSTGLERGFGYVTVTGVEAAKDGAQQVINVYNGTKWKGNKLRVGVAKGDYMQRLKEEWAEREKVDAAAKAALIPDLSRHKRKPQLLRIRKHPGER
ncbi:unnamed protein product [Choristocarpus tenellus]